MDKAPEWKSLIPPGIVGGVLFLMVVLAFLSAKNRTSAIVLPGGITYLGPTTTIAPTPTPGSGTLSVPQNARWNTYEGKKFPYRFSYPESFSLGVFPNDPFDAVTVFTPGTDGSNNIFFRVDDLKTMNKPAYIGKPEQYARDWWKSYAWKGVQSVTAFTNASGLSGYRATYLDAAGKTPYDHVFFSVPNHPEYILWISGRLFDSATFSHMIDSVSWKE